MKTPPPPEDSASAPESEPEVCPWRNVVLAARRARYREVPEDESAPYGFPARVVARWMDERRDRAPLLWQRWAVRAAAFSVVLAFLAVLAGRPFREARPILPFPGLEVPLPTDNPASS